MISYVTPTFHDLISSHLIVYPVYFEINHITNSVSCWPEAFWWIWFIELKCLHAQEMSNWQRGNAPLLCFCDVIDQFPPILDLLKHSACLQWSVVWISYLSNSFMIYTDFAFPVSVSTLFFSFCLSDSSPSFWDQRCSPVRSLWWTACGCTL